MAKRAVCISCFNFYVRRVDLVMEQLRGKGYQCTYLTADFSHFTKGPMEISIPDGEQVKTRPYRRNLSLARIRSHQCFARDAFRRVAQLQPDLIYVMVPPNSLAREAAKYKKKHPQVRLVLDLYDLWPETFPSRKAKKLLALPFALWRQTRDSGLAAADLIFSECDLFRQVIARQLAGKQVRTLPLCRDGVTAVSPLRAPEGEELALCYLGSINSLIDIDTLAALLREIKALRPVALHIIGEGETRERLIAAAQAAGARVVFHGRVYDPAQRQAVFDQCHFGVNIMKNSVCVGLTMKSLDYFAGGLPVLNTIEGDTRSLVESCQAGIPILRENLAETARRAARQTPEENAAMRRNTVRMFEEHFSVEAVRRVLAELE